MALNDNKNYFTTFDLGLAAVLICLGFPLDSLDKTNPQKVKFILQRSNELDEAIQAYWAKTLRIEPQSLLTNLKFLKNRIYSGE